jgi:hypothetical protein
MSDIDGIHSSEEISRILKIAETTNAEVYCEVNIVGAPNSVALEVRRAIGTNIVVGLKRAPNQSAQMLSTVFTNGLAAGTPVQIIISLVDGQYAIRDVVQDVSLSTFTVSAGRSLLRLQRRKDFRVSVRSDGLKFLLQTAKDVEALNVLDLSAGGLRLLWEPKHGPIPTLGTLVKGDLHLHAAAREKTGAEAPPPPEKVVTVEMKLVKDHGPDAPLKPDLGRAVSFQFQNPGQEESRAILFTCLFIHRNSYGV